MSTLSHCTYLLPFKGVVGHDEAPPDPGAVLRFVCTWESGRRQFEDDSHLLLRYFLSNDTMDLLQLPASVRDTDAFRLTPSEENSLPRIVKRQKIPKPSFHNALPAASGGLRPFRPAHGFYRWSDFAVGAPLQLLGVSLLLAAADGATEAFYAQNKASIDPFVEISATKTGPVRTEAALLRSQSTLPTAFGDYTQRGRAAMRFRAGLVPAPSFKCSLSDTKREFLVTYFLEDGTMEISEPPNRGTRTGGPRFLQRQIVCRPSASNPYTLTERYTHKDLLVGAHLPVLLQARTNYEAEGPKMFRLLAADSWTLDFMKSRPQDFPNGGTVQDLGEYSGASMMRPGADGLTAASTQSRPHTATTRAHPAGRLELPTRAQSARRHKPPPGSTQTGAETVDPQATWRVGNQVYGPDPWTDKYYNRRELGTRIIPEAIQQHCVPLSAWE